MKALPTVVVAVCFLAGGCSGGPSKKKAAEAVDKSIYNDVIYVLLAYGRIGDQCEDEGTHQVNMNPTTDRSYVAAEKAGLITVSADGPDYWKIDHPGLKPEVRQKIDSRPAPAAKGCSYWNMKVPLARRAVEEVTQIHSITSETAEVEYKWKWALTPQGEQAVNRLSTSQLRDLSWYYRGPALLREAGFSFLDLGQSTTPKEAKAMLKKNNDGWQVSQ